MKKSELTAAVTAAKAETRDALQQIYDTLNHGQKKQILKNPAIEKLFKLYHVSYEE